MGVFLHKAALYKVKDQLKHNFTFQLNTYPYLGISIHPIQSHIHLWHHHRCFFKAFLQCESKTQLSSSNQIYSQISNATER